MIYVTLETLTYLSKTFDAQIRPVPTLDRGCYERYTKEGERSLPDCRRGHDGHRRTLADRLRRIRHYDRTHHFQLARGFCLGAF